MGRIGIIESKWREKECKIGELDDNQDAKELVAVIMRMREIIEGEFEMCLLFENERVLMHFEW